MCPGRLGTAVGGSQADLRTEAPVRGLGVGVKRSCPRRWAAEGPPGEQQTDPARHHRSISREEGSYGFPPWLPGKDGTGCPAAGVRSAWGGWWEACCAPAQLTGRVQSPPAADHGLMEVTHLLTGGWVAVSPNLRYPGPLFLLLLWEEWLRPQNCWPLAFGGLDMEPSLMEELQLQPDILESCHLLEALPDAQQQAAILLGMLVSPAPRLHCWLFPFQLIPHLERNFLALSLLISETYTLQDNCLRAPASSSPETCRNRDRLVKRGGSRGAGEPVTEGRGLEAAADLGW